MPYRTWITITFPTPLIFHYHLPLRMGKVSPFTHTKLSIRTHVAGKNNDLQRQNGLRSMFDVNCTVSARYCPVRWLGNCVSNCQQISKMARANFNILSHDWRRTEFGISVPSPFIQIYQMVKWHHFQQDPPRWTIPLKIYT